MSEHIQCVRTVLQRLLEYRLFVKAEKCVFHAQLVSFLGFIISRGRKKMNPAKVRAVVEWPSPNNRKDLHRFLGFANFYRKFIKNYSCVVAPLTMLTFSAKPFLWTSAAEAAFLQLKRWFSFSSCFHSARCMPQILGWGHSCSNALQKMVSYTLVLSSLTVFLSLKETMMLETGSFWR